MNKSTVTSTDGHRRVVYKVTQIPAHQMYKHANTKRLTVYGLTSHSTHNRSFWGRFLQGDDQTNSVKALKETSWSSRSGLNPIRTTPPCYNNAILGNRLYAQRKGQTDRQTYIEGNDTDQFSVAGILIAVWHGPLQRNEVTVVDLDVFLSIPSDGFLLGQTNAAVLKRSEYRCWYVIVVTLHTQHTDDHFLTGINPCSPSHNQRSSPYHSLRNLIELDAEPL